MAASSAKKTTGKKQTTPKKTNTKSRTNSKTKTNTKTNRKANTKPSSNSKRQGRKDAYVVPWLEVFTWFVLLVCLFFFMSNIGFCGNIGKQAAAFSKNFFGILSYLMPIILFMIVGFCIANFGDTRAVIKTVVIIVVIMLICTLLQLMFNQGGTLGSVLCNILKPSIGSVGTFIVSVIFLIICAVLLTEKSAIRGIKKAGTRGHEAYANARVQANKRHEERTQRRYAEDYMEYDDPEEVPAVSDTRKKRRSSSKFSGVSYNTTLEGILSPEVRELVADEPEETAENIIETQSIKETQKKKGTKKKNEVPDMKSLYSEHSKELRQTAEEVTSGDSVIEKVTEEEPQQTEKDTQTRKKKERLTKKAAEQETAKVADQIVEDSTKENVNSKLPKLSLLTKGSSGNNNSISDAREMSEQLRNTLEMFGVEIEGKIIPTPGPSVTRFEFKPAAGIKVSKILGLSDDIKLALAAPDIRIEAPIPGKSAVGIEVPNKEKSSVLLRDLLESKEFRNSRSKLSYAVGKDISGKTIVADIAKMPHLLIAGATGSGKSVFINTIIMSILYKARPDEVRFIMIDPKVVELSVYNKLPHMLIPVVTDPKKAAGALNWAVAEMTRRYQAFAVEGVRDIKGYNAKIDQDPVTEDGAKKVRMNQIVVVVDELADLMMVAPKDVEEAICRLAQLARAAGIHLVIATQRPSVNVITGLIKANMPSRVALSVTSGVDSRTIIDMNGAEKLLGNGDMLFYPTGYNKPVRIQGAFVSDAEIQRVVDYISDNNEQNDFDDEITATIESAAIGGTVSAAVQDNNDRDAYFKDAGCLIIDKDKASIGMLQRTFKIGFNRAARIMDQLHEAGVVGPEEGTKPRKILMNESEFAQYLMDLNS